MASKLFRWMWSIALICAVCRLTEAFSWLNTETLVVNACVDSSATIAWRFEKGPSESVGTVHWFRFAKETIASLVDGKITNPVKRFSPSDSNAELSIAGLTLRDTGHYEVDVKVFSKNSRGDQSERVYSASAMLVVGDPPVISGRKLTVQEVTSNELCALKRQVTLRCGHFTYRGVPPVEVVWTDPAGQQLPSTRYADGMFDLDLPQRPLAGNYTCHALCHSPVLHCLGPSSPLLVSPEHQLHPLSGKGCTEADRRGLEEDPSALGKSQAIQRLEANLTELQEALIALQGKQARMGKESEEREEGFRVMVEELRELVLLSNQQSSGAQVNVLQQTLQAVQGDLQEVRQNVTALQRDRDRDHNEQKQEQDRDQVQRIQNMSNAFQDLETRLHHNDETIRSLEEKVAALSAGLSLTHNTMTSLQNALNLSVDDEPSLSEEHAQNVTDLWQSLSRLEQLHNDAFGELKEVAKAQEGCQRNQENLTHSLTAVSSRVDGVEHGLKRRVDKAVSQGDATRAKLGRLEQRLHKMEGGQPASVGEERLLAPEIDPLVAKAEPTFSLLSPWDGQSDSLLHDFVITNDGQVVMGDKYHPYVIVAPNTSLSDVITRPLKHGSHIRRLSNMPDGLVAATVDDHYILIVDPTNPDANTQRWVRTSLAYHGLAARSSQTLFVGVDSADADDGQARVDVVSVVDDVAVVVSTLLSGNKTSALRTPAGLTVFQDELYVCDWKSSSVIRLSLQTLQVTVYPGPQAQPGYRFYQPRQTAFDVSGNMYVTTGGKMCGAGDHVYSQGFCIVVVSREGWWSRLILRGQHVYPYGLALTPTGLAVSWGSWVHSPTRSLIQWYDLV